MPPSVTPSTKTGLDLITRIILNDTKLNASLSSAEVAIGAKAADGLNALLVDAIYQTGVANDGKIHRIDIELISDHIQDNHAAEWQKLNGRHAASGFELLQKTQNNSTYLFDRKAINQTADLLYDIGNGYNNKDQLLNDGGQGQLPFNPAVDWLNDLLKKDLAAGTLANPDLDLEIEATSRTGLDYFVWAIQNDAWIRRDVAPQDIATSARIADWNNNVLVEAIRETGVANDGKFTGWDVRAVSDYVQANYGDEWRSTHGSASHPHGFHLVSHTGANALKFPGEPDKPAVEYTAAWTYHIALGYTSNGNLIGGDGEIGNHVNNVARWFNYLLADDLKAGTLESEGGTVVRPPAPTPTPTPRPDAPGPVVVDRDVTPSTKTGLDLITRIILNDTKLNDSLSPAEVAIGAKAADGLNALLVDAIYQTGVANDGKIHRVDIRLVSDFIQDNHAAAWQKLNGEHGVSGFELLQKTQNNSTELFGRKAINQTADLLYDIGNGYNGKEQLLNDDGRGQLPFNPAVDWLNDLLKKDLAAGTLANPDLDLEVEATTGTGLDYFVETVQEDSWIRRDVAPEAIATAARVADWHNTIIIEAIRETRVADDGVFTGWDVRKMSDYIQDEYGAEWKQRHGNTKDLTGYHSISVTQANAIKFPSDPTKPVVEYTADWLYHIGLGYTADGKIFNGNGIPGNHVNNVADTLNIVLADDLDKGILDSGFETGLFG